MSVSLLQDKRGVSEVIGYVILIVIAVGLSVAVYAFLREQVPQEQAACPDDVSLTLESAFCQGNTLRVTIANRGLFSVDGVLLKVGDVGGTFKDTLCLTSGTSGDSCSLFNVTGSTHLQLAPGSTWGSNFSYTTTGAREIELEPIMIMAEGQRVLCDQAIVVQQVTCGGIPSS